MPKYLNRKDVMDDKRAKRGVIIAIFAIIFFVLCMLILVSDTKAQDLKFNGCAGIDYYTHYEMRYTDNNGNYIKDTHNGADFMKLTIGAKLSMKKKLSIAFRTETFTLKDEAGWFSPTQADYYWNLSYTPSPKIRVSFEHMCAHPVRRESWNFPEKYGSYDAIQIMFNF